MDTSFIYDASHQLSPLTSGTTFMLTANAGNGAGAKFIVLTDNCSVTGITFYWPQQSPGFVTPIVYPWAIHFNGGTAGTVKYCNFVNGYQCIYIENTLFSLVEEVRGQAFYRGIKCEGNYDVTRLRGVHFNASWSTTGPGAWQLLNSIAFDMGRNDGLILEDCFAFFYGTCFHFYDDPAHNFHGPSAPWVQVRGGGADYCNKPIWVEQTQWQGVDIDGILCSTSAATTEADITIAASNTGNLRIQNSQIFSWNGNFGVVAGSGGVTVNNCEFIGNGGPQTFAQTGWAVTGSGYFSLRDCTFLSTQTHLTLGSSVTRAVVTGNMTSGTFTFTNSMGAGQAVILGNSGGDTVYVGADARLVAISGGVKLEVRNTGTGTWIEGTRYTNP